MSRTQLLRHRLEVLARRQAPDRQRPTGLHAMDASLGPAAPVAPGPSPASAGTASISRALTGASACVALCRAGSERLELIDHALLLRIRRFESRRLTQVMQALTRLGDAATWGFASLLLAAAGADSLGLALLLWTAAGLGLVVSQPLKRACRRRRPTARLAGFTALVENPDHFSFPSGHTTVAWSVAVALGAQSPELAALMLPLAAAIGISRVYLGAHYPLDVAAGALLGTGCGLATLALVA
jgi:undecaprenyl-diphosphatase